MAPVKAAGMKASTITSVRVTRMTRADQLEGEMLLKIAHSGWPGQAKLAAKVSASRGTGGHRNGMYSMIVDEAPESVPLFDTYNLVR